jgi:hypothetical protein
MNTAASLRKPKALLFLAFDGFFPHAENGWRRGELVPIQNSKPLADLCENEPAIGGCRRSGKPFR